MPLMKIYVDSAVGAGPANALADGLSSLRDLICQALDVDVSLCQFSVLTIRGLSDQAQISVELALMPKAERTRDYILGVCHQLRDAINALTKIVPAVRVTMLDPETYIALRP